MLWEFDLDSVCWAPAQFGASDLQLAAGARLIHLPRGGCALLSRGGAVVNGLRPLPLVILSDRDEIQCGGRTFYFANDAAAAPAAFVSQGRDLRCARCQSPMRDGEMSVQCPACHAHHHEACWNYERSPGCQLCQHPVAQFAWRPEQLS